MNLPVMPVASADFLSGYQPLAGAVDEMQAAPGVVRPHWTDFMMRLHGLGADDLEERRDKARHLLHEHGVTYNVYADGESAARTWELDMLPLMIAPTEWKQLEAALVQRTQLLNAVLADLYGEQQLVHRGLIPPAIVHANPGFLRPCHGVRPQDGRFLTLHAIDLARAPNGQWWVVTDRTQAPSGVGYTLENRIIMSRVMQDEFRAGNVHRIASFFHQRKLGLRSLAPWTDAPNVVLLTPGPLSETYFEHAYLARYLGYTLVEGSDLTVRDQRVFIRTIEGLQRVDVIIRRVDDTFCDPLELRSDSFLGVPGLIEATRAGTVAISNALGAGAVEAPALLAFLPALSRHLLGEELRLPNVATWWCGQTRERNYTLENMHGLMVKRGFVARATQPIFGDTLDAAGRRELAARINANPHAYVGQERVPFSTAPVWTGQRLEPRPLILRCFVCATKDGYMALPGGLTRVSASPSSQVISSRLGGGSKDTWVLSDKPVEEFTLLTPRGTPASPDLTFSAVSSRTAENLFWLGRYAERLEDATRLLRVAISRIAGEGGATEDAELAAVLQCLVQLDKLPPYCATRIPVAGLSQPFYQLIFSTKLAGSVRSLLKRIAFITASVRDRLSADTWRILNHLQTEFPADPDRFDAGQVLQILHRLIFQLAAFSGVEMENMTRGHGWRFLDIGRRLERASNLASTVGAALAADPAGDLVLGPILEYSDSIMTYRRQHAAHPDWPGTLVLLFSDRTNPRSMGFQLNSLRKHIAKLPGLNAEPHEREQFTGLQTDLLHADFAALGLAVLEGESEELEALLERMADGAWDLSDFLTRRFFSHVIARVS